MVKIRIWTGELTPPIQSLEDYFRNGGVSIIQAAFAHSFFVHPDVVRAKTPFYPDRARYSREHYPGVSKGEYAVWPGDGRQIRLDDNQYAQNAWAGYTKRRLARRSGYGLRHIWGNTHDPNAFTAGWNFCYMPFWAGMLTERQHPHEELERAIRQASWDLYFRNDPVRQPPDFVMDPGMDLDEILQGQPLQLLVSETAPRTQSRHLSVAIPIDGVGAFERVKTIRTETHQSWSNINKAVKALQGKAHDPFGTQNVENSSKTCVRRILRETGMTAVDLETLLVAKGFA